MFCKARRWFMVSTYHKSKIAIKYWVLLTHVQIKLRSSECMCMYEALLSLLMFLNVSMYIFTGIYKQYNVRFVYVPKSEMIKLKKNQQQPRWTEMKNFCHVRFSYGCPISLCLFNFFIDNKCEYIGMYFMYTLHILVVADSFHLVPLNHADSWYSMFVCLSTKTLCDSLLCIIQWKEGIFMRFKWTPVSVCY